MKCEESSPGSSSASRGRAELAHATERHQQHCESDRKRELAPDPGASFRLEVIKHTTGVAPIADTLS